MIRRKKIAKLIEREKQVKAQRDWEERVGAERNKLLKRFLAPDALEYLQRLKTNTPAVGNQVEEVILYLVTYRGVRQVISLLDVRYIERQVSGEETKIRIQRDGEVSDFSQYVKEAIEKDKHE
ncbi:MAG: hypothetical protein EAX95_09430 [Candidatus Thorarchaeota archaeon]|nr:hypothetical protein [Candidatus Thorarchaeota archaeon]